MLGALLVLLMVSVAPLTWLGSLLLILVISVLWHMMFNPSVFMKMLILLEATTMAVIFLFAVVSKFMFMIVLCLLTFFVCESAVALSVLVSLSRNSLGNSQI